MAPSIRLKGPTSAVQAAPKQDAAAAGGEDSSHILIGFLQSQSQNTLTRLYQKPSSCLSLFRLLHPLERQIVMSLLWLESPTPASTLAAWVTREGKKPYHAALATLARLHILPPAAGKLALNPTFRGSLRQAITGGGASGSFGVPAETGGAPALAALDAYALERWETMLYYMVSSGTGQFPTKPSQGVLFLLQRSGLMANVHGTPQITSSGFQFLLHPPHKQLWELLLQYLHMAEERQMDLVEILSFLFMLSTMELGREYLTEPLSATQRAMLEDLRDYGLVQQQDGAGAEGSAAGFIVLETNYRLYAYTENALQIAVLNLFVTLKARYPNLVVGAITRESVKKALQNGISADQIISYLVTHAHAQMRKNKPLLPVTVQDQIRLWELEKNRMKSVEGYLYTAFASQADYQYVLNYAKELDVVLWENTARRSFFGSIDGHANIRGFIERRTAGNA